MTSIHCKCFQANPRKQVLGCSWHEKKTLQSVVFTALNFPQCAHIAGGIQSQPSNNVQEVTTPIGNGMDTDSPLRLSHLSSCWVDSPFFGNFRCKFFVATTLRFAVILILFECWTILNLPVLNPCLMRTKACVGWFAISNIVWRVSVFFFPRFPDCELPFTPRGLMVFADIVVANGAAAWALAKISGCPAFSVGRGAFKILDATPGLLKSRIKPPSCLWNLGSTCI
mmetsp:Transcript_47275/g.96605  ORF Transcript_47275/g.96605 Transcript_47275/m.96605 type:complete len:226 (-) Transcript_47275:151-828(-)